jgi:hypothetical protein
LHNTLENTRNIRFEQYITSLSIQTSITPITKADRSWAKSNLEKAENVAEHFSQVSTSHNSEHHHNNDEIEKFLNASCEMSLPIKAFSPREVRQVIKK